MPGLRVTHNVRGVTVKVRLFLVFATGRTHVTRKLILVPLFAIGMLLGSAMPASAATASDVRGIWTGVDSVDGSDLTLVVAGSGTTFRVVYFDDDATEACDSVPALLAGSATLSGDTLSGTISGFCFDGTAIGPFGLEWQYDPESGTLSDSVGGSYSKLFG